MSEAKHVFEPEDPPAKEDDEQEVLLTVLRIEAEEEEAANRRALQALSDEEAARRFADDEEKAARRAAELDAADAKAAKALGEEEEENYKSWANQAHADERASQKAAAAEAKIAARELKAAIRGAGAARKAMQKQWKSAGFSARVRRGELALTLALGDVASCELEPRPAAAALRVRCASAPAVAALLERAPLEELRAQAPGALGLGKLPKELFSPVELDCVVSCARAFGSSHLAPIWDVESATHAYDAKARVLTIKMQRHADAPADLARSAHELSVSFAKRG